MIMPSHHLYKCDHCDYEAIRYRNVTRCERGGNLVRVETPIRPGAVEIEQLARNLANLAFAERHRGQLDRIRGKAADLLLAIIEQEQRGVSI